MNKLALLLLAFSSLAGAAEVSVDAGQCRYGLSHEGTFYQSDHYTKNYTHPPCWSISYSDRFKDSRFGYEIGWHDFGKAEGRGNMAVADEEVGRGLVCDPSTGTGCEVRFDTWARVRGVETSLTGTWNWGEWFAKGKTGLLFYEMRTHSDLTFFDGATAQYDRYSGFFNEPAWGFGLSGGYRINKQWSASVGVTRWFWIGEHRPLSIVENDLTQYSARVSFAF